MKKEKPIVEPKFPVGSIIRHVCGGPDMVVAECCPDSEDGQYICTWMSSYPGGYSGLCNYRKEREAFFESELRSSR